MKVLAVLMCAGVLAVTAVSVLAHQETFKGTVLAVERAAVRVNLVNPRTKVSYAETFKVDADTKILRGDALVTLASAKIQRGENIAVTTDHDLDETLAVVIRLDAAK